MSSSSSSSFDGNTISNSAVAMYQDYFQCSQCSGNKLYLHYEGQSVSAV